MAYGISVKRPLKFVKWSLLDENGDNSDMYASGLFENELWIMQFKLGYIA